MNNNEKIIGNRLAGAELQMISANDRLNYNENIHDARKSGLGRTGWYFLTIFLFLVVVGICMAFDSRVGHDPGLFLFMVFSLCMAPFILVKESSGRYCLLVLAGPLMFLYFGFNDLLSYFLDLRGRYVTAENSILTHAELVILIGIAALFVGYIVAARILGRSKQMPFSDDWKTGNTVVLGIICVVVGLYATYLMQIAVDYRQNVDLGSESSAAMTVFSRMLEPFGAVLLSYAYMKTRSYNLLVVILVIAAVKLPIGLILNSKEIGISFIATFLVTKWIYDGKLPLRWVAIFATVLIIYFPLSYAYRTALQSKSLSVMKSMGSIDVLMDKAVASNAKEKKPFDGLDKFAGRNDYKTIIELTVHRFGVDLPFMGGKTYIELPFVFIPRLIMPNKPAFSVGQTFNRQLKLSANKNTYISTTFLGEFYWNFGTLGVLCGMFCTGLFWGVIGSVANIREKASVTRLLILISAVYTLILKFETGFAQQNIVFLRSCLISSVLHLLFRYRRSAALSEVEGRLSRTANAS